MAQLALKTVSKVAPFAASTITGGITGIVGGGVTGAATGGVSGAATGLISGFVGGVVSGPVTKFANQQLRNIFTDGKHSHGRRLSNFRVQSSAYGETIPVVYGTTRIAGNIIWSRPIQETATTTSQGGKGSSPGTTRTEYSYSATLAIAICEGEIDEVLRVWIDSKLIDPVEFSGSYTLYTGASDQAVDPVIEGFEGVGNVPAYRDLAYVVIEDFPLGDFGNRIPNFTFEVKRRVLVSDLTDTPVEDLIKSMIMIPGSGEFVYDTQIQQKVSGELVGSTFVQQEVRSRINHHNNDNKANALVALDQLEATCQNLEWVGVVVTWFGNDLDAGNCTILPGVEFDSGAITEPESWNVGNFTRSTAHLITQDGNGNPVYGGTPDDDSIIRYLDELKNRGYNIMFYPMFFMDTANKPWRGRVTGSSSDTSNFFTKTNGYNAFINHYANLVVGKVDAFVIGSELIGLTSVQDIDDSFPAVDELISLAATVKSTLGGGVKVTYAADWSEYHHEVNGWYNLDPLWASANIDFIGIDAYFPLTDTPQNGYDTQDVIDGWTSGEGYDWYYSDPQRTVQTSLSQEYAWKNIQWWWENQHVNPDMVTTAWVPESKPIWFTEYGFPSVDGATNQPNVFYDPNSSESAFPYHSRGIVDFQAQRTGLEGTELKWKDSTMIERMFIWTWDARPFPFWPDLHSVWTDGDLWPTGHWVQGKLGLSNLGAIVADLCRRAGLVDSQFDTTRLTDLVYGFVLDDRIAVVDAIHILRAAYFFDAVESDGVLTFIKRGGAVMQSLTENDLVPLSNDQLAEVLREKEINLPQKVDVMYISKSFNYQVGNQHGQRLTAQSDELFTLNLPIIMTDQYAKYIADVTLYNRWMERNHYVLQLPINYAALEPTDVIEVILDNITHRIRITDTYMETAGVMQVQGVAEDVSVYDFGNQAGDITSEPDIIVPVGDTQLELLDLPALPSDDPMQGALRYAVSGLEEGWQGSVVYRSDDGGTSYLPMATLTDSAVIGMATNALGDAAAQLFDEANSVTVIVLGSELESVSELAVLNGANVALLGNEVIQFKTATLVAPGKYTLSGLLRGRLGTEHAIAGHAAGESFVLLDSRLEKVVMPNHLIGLERYYKPVSVGHTLTQTTAQSFTYQGVGLKPWSPVHLTGGRDGSSNLTIDWVRRTRVGGDWRDGVDIPLGEETEAYEVDIMDGSNVVRTISVSTNQASYSAAEQTTDFGSPQSNVDIKVYQLSAVVGRGYEGTESV